MFKRIALAIAATVCLSSAFANSGTVNGAPATGTGFFNDPYQLGTLGSSPTTLAASSDDPGFGDPIEDYANFSVAADSQVSISGMILNASMDDLTVRLLGGTTMSSTGLISSFAGDGSTSTFSLTAGDYHLIINGHVASGFNAGNYQVTMSAMPVPEPETYALMLAGLGAVGFIARRRRPH